MSITEMAIIPSSMKRVFSTNGIHAQLLRYGAAGGIAALVDVGSFYVFATYMQVYYLIAVFLSFSLGTFTNFLICNACIFDRMSGCYRRVNLHSNRKSKVVKKGLTRSGR